MHMSPILYFFLIFFSLFSPLSPTLLYLYEQVHLWCRMRLSARFNESKSIRSWDSTISKNMNQIEIVML